MNRDKIGNYREFFDGKNTLFFDILARVKRKNRLRCGSAKANEGEGKEEGKREGEGKGKGREKVHGVPGSALFGYISAVFRWFSSFDTCARASPENFVA